MSQPDWSEVDTAVRALRTALDAGQETCAELAEIGQELSSREGNLPGRAHAENEKMAPVFSILEGRRRELVRQCRRERVRIAGLWLWWLVRATVRRTLRGLRWLLLLPFRALWWLMLLPERVLFGWLLALLRWAWGAETADRDDSDRG